MLRKAYKREQKRERERDWVKRERESEVYYTIQKLQTSFPLTPSKTSLNKLAIPDTFCSMQSGSGYQCPEGMLCRPVNLTKNVSGFNGFDNFGE